MSYLAHYGTPRHSGRYPWGSGDNPYQHNAEFLKTVQEMKEFLNKELLKQQQSRKYGN